jgi:hypothetical protein
MLKFTRKRVGILASIGVLAIAGAAFAYWTTTGDGTGTGQNGTDAANLVVTGTVGGLLYPGGDAQDVSFTVANPSEFDQSLSKITLDSVTAYGTEADRTAGENAISGCGTDDYSMDDVIVDPATDGDIAREATAQALTTTGSIEMLNLATNQDACKDAFLLLSFSTE